MAVPSQFVAPGGPQVSGAPGPGPSGLDMVARGLDQLGDAVARHDEQRYAVRRENDRLIQGTTLAQRSAQLTADMATFVADQRQQAAPGAAGHEEALATHWNAQADAFLEGITDPTVRAHALDQLASIGSQYRASETIWAADQRARLVATNAADASDLTANTVRGMTDAGAIDATLTRATAAVEALPLSGELRAKLSRQTMAEGTRAAIGGAIDRGELASARARLDSDAAKAVLNPKVVDALTGDIAASERRNAAEARAAAAQDAAMTRDQLAARGTDLDGGAGTYSDRMALAAQYAALGDQSKATEWTQKAGAFRATAGSRDWTMPQLDARITELDGKRDRGGLSPAEAQERAGLIDQRSATKGRLDQEGGALLQASYATGRAIAPLDLSNPAAMAARAGQARDAARRYGRTQIEPLTASELPGLRDQMADGMGGRQLVLGTIAHFGDPRAIVGAAQQLAGTGDPGFVMAARALSYPAGAQLASAILAGQEAEKTNGGKWNEAKAKADFGKWYGGALRDTGADLTRDVYEGAKAFYMARSDGTYDPGRFAQAIETVLGRSQGGGRLRGGVTRQNGWLILVPPGMAPDDMTRRFARGSIADYQSAADGHAPTWGDGHPMTRAELRGMVPRLLADGRYGFVNPRDGRLLPDTRGGIYAVDVNRLPGR